MISSFILIAAFAHSYGPRVNYVNLGEFENAQACQRAAEAARKAGADINLAGHTQPRFVCVSKR